MFDETINITSNLWTNKKSRYKRNETGGLGSIFRIPGVPGPIFRLCFIYKYHTTYRANKKYFGYQSRLKYDHEIRPVVLFITLHIYHTETKTISENHSRKNCFAI